MGNSEQGKFSRTQRFSPGPTKHFMKFLDNKFWGAPIKQNRTTGYLTIIDLTEP